MILYFFGDSITTGKHVSIHKIWASRISKTLNERFSDLHINNASVNGNTTRMALERMYVDVISHKPDIVYIQYGLNDCKILDTDFGCEKVSKAGYIENLREIIEKCFASGVKRVVLNTSHRSNIPGKLPHSDLSYDESNDAYYHLLKEFQSQHIENVHWIDVRAYLENINAQPQDYLMDDGLHLNERGHQHYYEYICPEIEKVILTLGC
jgi:lysophospholipase L1-like esterase